ncbi:unnamed protein product [marine sediment metagenome]|uniref:Uncharacterized protein n=1 Tax=marine sediment metagenome TaxID=412755 RepID=X0VZH8_9ZZZZ
MVGLSQPASTVPLYGGLIFIQVIQEFSEPGWIVNHNIYEKNGGQRQEKYNQVHQQYSKADEDAISHCHK